MVELIRITPEHDGIHKYRAEFRVNGRTKVVKFGAVGYLDFTQHHDENRRRAYILRHSAREDWTNPVKAGALSRWVLWEHPSFEKAVLMFRRKFGV